MTKQKLLLYLLLLMGMVQGAMAQEPYAALSDDNTVLTFYYDTHKAERNGMSIGPFENYSFVRWYNQKSTITHMVFDASFADYTTLTSTANWFYDCSKLTTITHIENLKTDNVTDMSNMFYMCSSLTSLDVSGFKTDNVTSMRQMFLGCSGLTSLDVSGFKTDNVTNMSGMFLACSGLTSLDVSGFKTDNVTSMDRMFNGCRGLTSLDVSGFKTDNVTKMSDMFSGCSGLTSLDVSGFKTDNVTNMRSMFYYCNKLKSLDVSGFKTDKVTSMREMFYGCYGLTSLDLSGFKTDNVTDMSQMFYKCSGLTSLDLSGFKTDNVTDMSYMFMECSSLTSLDLSGFKTDNVTSMYNMFYECSGLTSLDVSGFKTDNVTNMTQMFRDCSGLTSLDVSGFKTDNVTSMSFMFFGCSGLTSLDVSGFKTDKVTNMGGMFWGCSSLTNLDVSDFKTDNVTDMSYMFYGCSGLTSLDVSGFKTDNVTDMKHMFYECSGLTSLDVSGFKTDNVTGMYGMFGGCSSLTTIYADETKWSTDKVTSGYSMFYNCTKLVGGNGTTYSSEHTDYEYARIDKPGQPGYFTEIIISTAITLNVTDDNGNDITQDVNIVWYDGDGNQIGTGSKLNGVGKNVEVYYSVLLEESMGRVYREVNMRKADTDEDGVVACQLEKIGRVTLEGRVSATDIDKTMATVSVRQMLNGKWQQDYSTQTDRKGVFSIEVYDDVTDITISGDGYLDATLHRDGFGGSGNVGTIPVSLLSGFAIAANVSIEQAVATGEAPLVTAWTDGLTNIDFNLTNLTKGTALTDVSVQGGNVVIKSGAAVGDEIKLTAVSKQGVFADAETTFTIAEGANSFDLQLTELGGVDATCTTSNNGTTVGYLYDNDDRLAARGSYRGETLTLRHLKSGTYTLVSMGQSLLLGSMTSLADLNAVGLNEGADYVATRIDVANGELTAASISDVPRLDETPFYYTTGNTYFKAGKASVTAGNYITLQAHVDLKPEHADKANGVTLTVDLPEGCQMVENSVIANRQAVPHTVSGNRVTMTLAKEQYESEVRFCVTPTLNQSYTVTAMATFDIDGQVQQPIGTALFEAKGLSLRTPKYTSSTAITINGTAKGHSEVNIYDNDVLVGTTTSKANGSWTAQCELYKPYSHSFHDIYAKITTEDGLELTSETKQVEYNKTGIVPSSVMMTFYNGWYKKNIDVTFDLLNGTTSPSSYPFYTATDFTFLADFTRNDPDQIKNVSIKVLNSDGTVRTLPATFDGNQGKWVATTKYSSASRLPRNVTVEYDLLSAPIIYDEEMEEAMNSLINNMLEEVDYAYKDCKLEMTSEDNNSISFTATTNGYDTKENYKLTLLDYEQVKAQYANEEYCHIQNDTTDMCFCISYIQENMCTIIVWDNLNKVAVELSDGLVAQPTFSRQRRIIPFLMYATYGVGISIAEYNLRMKEIVMWRKTLESEQEMRSKNYNRMVELLYSTCPDGSYKIKEPDVLNGLKNQTDVLSKETQDYLYKFQDVIDKQQLRLKQLCSLKGSARVVISAGGAIVGGIFKAAAGASSGIGGFMSGTGGVVLQNLGKAMTSLGINALSTLAGQSASDALDYKSTSELDNSGLYPEKIISEWYQEQSKQLTNDYVQLVNSIKSSYSKCEKEKEDEEDNEEEKKDEPVDEKSDDKSDFDGNGTTPIIDPSGYVYEAVLSNRLEGVTTTCYEQVNGSAVLWNAEDYSQQNPLRTDETGFYRWDVPQGMWQVKYEKEGYETAYSEWLPVPPPQLDVNVGMKQSTPPTVKQMRGYEEGITVEMAKYMRPETMTTANITVTRNGLPETGSIVALNTEQAPLGEETYVSKVRFVPETGFNGTDQVVVTVHKEVESYCGVQMTADHVETVKIEAEVKSIVADSAVTVAYQGERELRVVVLPKGAAAGKTLRVNSSSQMIAAVSASEVVIGQDGLATLTVNGRLPGGAVLDFAIDGSDVTATTKVQVVMGRDMVATPTASIASGETVNSGTMLTLSSATPGATIYYTLDGSCPCDEATRIRYEAPIAITESVVVKAIAVKDGMDDSDVATFIYMLAGIRSAKLDAQVRIACHDRVLTVTGAEGGSCQIYDLNGRELSSQSNMGSEARFHLKGVDVCLVHIRQRNGQSAVYKIQAQ